MVHWGVYLFALSAAVSCFLIYETARAVGG